MSYRKSVYDSISEALAPVIRKLSDIQIDLIGTHTQIIRILEIADDIDNDGFNDLLGDSTSIYSGQIVNNVIIDYPFSEVELLASTDQNQDQSAHSITLEDLLPIKMVIPFNGDWDEDPIDIDENDLIVDVLFDHKGNKIPIVMYGPKLISGIYGKYEVSRVYELTLKRGQMEPEIQSRINEFINYLGTPTVSSTSPSSGDLNVDVSTTPSMSFTIRMNTPATEDAISFIPPIDIDYYTWNSSGTAVTLQPLNNLVSGTLYSGVISTSAQSEGGIALEEDYNWSFNTVS